MGRPGPGHRRRRRCQSAAAAETAMSGAKRPRGRPKGTGKAFSTDRDRYVIALTDALLATGVKFEHAAMLAIYFHWRDRIALPVDALHSVRRLGLSVRVQEHLRK